MEALMGVTFPNESPEYRAARDKLLQHEAALRREMEAVAAEIRALPSGGAVPEDYNFDHIDAKGAPAKVRLSELFRPGTDTLIIYHFMFPRHRSDKRRGPSGGPTAQLPLEEGPCPSCTALLDNWEGAVSHDEGQQVPILTVFHKGPDGVIRLSWASELLFMPTEPKQDPRHVGTVEPMWTLLDLTPGGRPDANEQIEYERVSK